MVLSPAQKYPQHKAVSKRGKCQNQAKHSDLSLGQSLVPSLGCTRLRGGAPCYLSAVLGGQQPQEGLSAAEATAEVKQSMVGLS